MATAMTCPVCGYLGTYKTPAMAAAHFPRHSCEKEQRLDARAARVVAAKVREGVKRDCVCKNARHEHGTRTAYVVDKCRCRPCMDANSAEQGKRARAQLFGRYDSGRVDAVATHTHLQLLLDGGVGLRRVSELTGISRTVLVKIRGTVGKAPQGRVMAETAELILAIRPTLDTMADGTPIDATGTHRRLQALMVMGWSRPRLGEHLGLTRTNMHGMFLQGQVTVRRARQVRELYNQFWDKPQVDLPGYAGRAANRARNYAAARGWVSPLAWDDATIDDPATAPDMGATTDKVEARLEDIEHMITTGATFLEAAQRLGMTEDYLERYCARYQRYDLVTKARTQERNRDYRRAS